jgi:DNA adenine methylase
MSDSECVSQYKNISPLRYPGGKSKACKVLNAILLDNFDISKYDNIISPFFGGGSFEFHLQNQYNHLNITANDKFTPLYNFWNVCKTNNTELCEKLYGNLNIDKNTFLEYRKTILDINDNIEQAYMYFVINRCSFSGATLSGGFSAEASKKRFTKSSIERIKQLNLNKFSIYNLDFNKFMDEKCLENENNLLFLDPPYYLDKKSKLYGNNGDMHENFEHVKLFDCISKKKNWFMTYNNCSFIKDLYKDYKIIETSWNYGMNKSKESSEIVIIG